MAEAHCRTSPLQVPFFPVMGKPGTEQLPPPQQLPPAALQPPDQLSYNFNIMQLGQSQPGTQPVQMEPPQNIQNFYNLNPMTSAQSVNPFMAPVMAVILPNYPTFTPGFPSLYLPPVPSAVPQAPNMMTGFAPDSASFGQPHFQAQPSPRTQTSPGLLCSQRASSVGEEEEEAAEPRALFSSSRSSSPLQLNLLQEELPKVGEGHGSTKLNRPESLHERATEVSVLVVSLPSSCFRHTGSERSNTCVHSTSLGSGSNL